MALACGASAAVVHPYSTAHFRIESPLDPRFVAYIKSNAEAYYAGMVPEYFSKEFDQPLVIYFSSTQEETRQLLRGTGEADVGYGLYLGLRRTLFGSEPVLYTHRTMDDGSLSLWGTLFHEITHHFIHLNYGACPAWFNEGLASFLGERTRIVHGALTIGRPNPWRELELRTMIESGLTIDVARLVSLSDQAFYQAREGYPLSRALFFWLHDRGRLKTYLRAVRDRGYGLSTLETAASMSAQDINRSLLAFIKGHCYPAAFLSEGESAKDPEQQKAAYLRALEIQPDFHPALMALATQFYNEGAFQQCRETSKPVVNDPRSADYADALQLVGDSYYAEEQYAQALSAYQQALEASEYREDAYRLSYWIACCYGLLQEEAKAGEWFQKFLDVDWEPTAHPEWTSTAQRVLAFQRAHRPAP